MADEPVDPTKDKAWLTEAIVAAQNYLSGKFKGTGRQSFTVRGDSVTFVDLAQAQKLRQQWIQELRDLQRAEKQAAGLGSGRRIIPRFRSF